MSETSSAPTPEKNKPKLNTLFVGVGLAIAVLVLVASVFFLLRTTKVVEPAALIVGDVEVSQSVFDEYVSLGKKEGLTKSQVRDIVVEYEKNKQMAKKFDISVPEEYAKQVGAGMQYGLGSETSQTQKDDVFEQAKRYNKTFLARLTQTSQEGYGVFIYDIPAILNGPDADIELAIDEAKKTATEYRNKIESKKSGAAAVLEEVSSYNASYGQAAKTGAYYITTEKMPYDDPASKSVRSNAYILSQIKDKPMGLTEVIVSGDNSAYFVDVLFKQKKMKDVQYNVQEAKDSIKVVIYDK